MPDIAAVAPKSAELDIVAVRPTALLKHQDELVLAAVEHRKALRIAVEQEAKLWELRAAMSLATLRRDQGRHAEACELLVPVYGWFTEGFDTPDLKEAKTLLKALNQ
jgi:predicted ATPase